MKYLKLFEQFLVKEDIDLSEGFSEKLRNYIETKGFDGKGFKDGLRVFVPQNVDSRAVSYKTETGWVLNMDNAKKEKISFFVLSPDGKVLTCYDFGNIFSGGDNSTLLDAFNVKFKTNCQGIEVPNVWE